MTGAHRLRQPGISGEKNMRRVLHYLFAVGILAVYGGQV
jgi:hypothetical protein